MKTINRTFLPEIIINDNKEYFPIKNGDAQYPVMGIAKQLEDKGYLIIICKVLSVKLRKSTDLHGKPYKPTEFIFFHKKEDKK